MWIFCLSVFYCVANLTVKGRQQALGSDMKYEWVRCTKLLFIATLKYTWNFGPLTVKRMCESIRVTVDFFASWALDLDFGKLSEVFWMYFSSRLVHLVTFHVRTKFTVQQMTFDTQGTVMLETRTAAWTIENYKLAQRADIFIINWLKCASCWQFNGKIRRTFFWEFFPGVLQGRCRYFEPVFH